MSPIACENASDVLIEACLNSACENISTSIDDGVHVIKMMANLTRQRIYLIIILLTSIGMVVQKSHPVKISESACYQYNYSTMGSFVALSFLPGNILPLGIITKEPGLTLPYLNFFRHV